MRKSCGSSLFLLATLLFAFNTFVGSFDAGLAKLDSTRVIFVFVSLFYYSATVQFCVVGRTWNYMYIALIMPFHLCFFFVLKVNIREHFVVRE